MTRPGGGGGADEQVVAARRRLVTVWGMTSPQTVAPDEILLVSVEGRLGHVTLNRPRQLNALSVDLIDQLAARLRAWADDDAIGTVLLTGAGEKGLCAGGDIKQLYAGVKSGEGPGDFFTHEYAMNLLIARYPKPYVAVMDGITMGGGVGVSVHGSVRVVTERTVVAMPETGSQKPTRAPWRSDVVMAIAE